MRGLCDTDLLNPDGEGNSVERLIPAIADGDFLFLVLWTILTLGFGRWALGFSRESLARCGAGPEAGRDRAGQGRAGGGKGKGKGKGESETEVMSHNRGFGGGEEWREVSE